MTTGTDTVFGTAKSDTINATQLTYTAGDTIVDSSTIDNDTMTITATDDITATPTVVGIENVNFNLDAASSATATVNSTTFSVDAASIGAGTLTAKVTKAASTVNAASITNVKSGMTLATDLATMTVTAVNDADLTINMTSTSASTVSNVTGLTTAIDDLTINASGNFTLANTTADENVVINGEGSVEITDMNAATEGSKNNLTVNAKGAVVLTDTDNAGSISLTTTTGNITAALTNHGANTGAQDLTMSTNNGNVTLTDGGNIDGTLTITAIGDSGVGVNTAADGDVAVSDGTAILAETINITASGAITLDDATAADTVTLSAGEDSSIVVITDAQTLNLSSAVAADATSGNAVAYTLQASSFDEIDNVNFTGSNDVTLKVADIADLVTAAASTDNSTTAAAVIMTDNTTNATTKLHITGDLADATTLDLSKMGVDLIQLATTQTDADGNDLFKVAASGTKIELLANQTVLGLTAAAVAGNTATLVINDDATAGTAYDIASLVSANIATLTVEANDTGTTGSNLTTINVGTANDIVITGAGDVTVGTSVTAKTYDASNATGDHSIKLVNTIDTIIKTGSGDDTFTTDGTANNYVIDGGAGVDTLVVAKDEDFSAISGLTLTNIEKIDVSGSDNAGDMVFAGSQMTGKSYVVFGDNATDNVSIDATNATGEIIDLSGLSFSQVVATLTGGAGGDTLTGSATSATTIIGGAGTDTIYGGEGADTITGGADNDTIYIADTSAAADSVVLATGSVDTIYGFTTTEDSLNLTGFVASTTETDVTVASSAATYALASANYFFITTDGTAASLTTNGTATLDAADYTATTLTDVAAYLSEQFTAANTGGAAAKSVIVLNDTVSGEAYVYQHTEDNIAGVLAAELELVGIVMDSTVVAGDVA